MMLRRPALVALVCCSLLLCASPLRAETKAERSEFVTGLTLASVGGAGAVVATVGSFAYIAHTEDTGIWGWMALISGTLTFSGGVVMANSQPKGEVGGIISIGAGIFSVALGVIGLSLQTPEEKRRNAVWSLTPLLATGAGGERLTMLGLQGVF